jgi:hypothetical protein
LSAALKCSKKSDKRIGAEAQVKADFTVPALHLRGENGGKRDRDHNWQAGSALVPYPSDCYNDE